MNFGEKMKEIEKIYSNYLGLVTGLQYSTI